jgi:hypothetical protein
LANGREITFDHTRQVLKLVLVFSPYIGRDLVLGVSILHVAPFGYSFDGNVGIKSDVVAFRVLVPAYVQDMT